MTRATIPLLAVAATAAELVLGVALVAGFRLRWTALASACPAGPVRRRHGDLVRS